MAEKQRSRRETKEERVEQEFADEEMSPVRDLGEAYDDVRQRFRGMFELPEDFTLHLRAARREMLLAIRSLIDARIEDLEESEKRREAGRRSRVQID